MEWQIYFVFPLILWLARRTSLAIRGLATVALVLAAKRHAGSGAPFDKINHLTPQFLVLFALGVLAIHLGRSERAARRMRCSLRDGLAILGGLWRSRSLRARRGSSPTSSGGPAVRVADSRAS